MEKKVDNDFGKWGWSMIIYAAFTYYIAAAVSTDGLNFFPEAFAAMRGWNANVLTSMASIGGWIGVAAVILFSIIAQKKGTRFVAVIGNILVGAALLVFAYTTNYAVFIASSIISIFLVGSIQLNVVPNTLMNMWFPKKKGIALGWATMGLPLCTATFVAFMAWITNVTGSISHAYAIFAGIIIAFGVVSIFWVKDTPEQLGLLPDHEKINAEDAKTRKQNMAAYKSKWTTAKLLRCKNVWCIGIGLGLLWMTTVGIVSRLIPRLLQAGYTQNKALSLLTIAAAVGMAGSYFWGWLDQKCGTKKACMVYGFWYLAALIMLMIPGSALFTYISVFLVGVGIGGIGNLIPSMIGTCFGREEFLAANKVIAPINTIIRCSAFVVMSLAVSVTGSLTGAYAIFFVTTLIGILLIAMIESN